MNLSRAISPIFALNRFRLKTGWPTAKELNEGTINSAIIVRVFKTGVRS